MTRYERTNVTQNVTQLRERYKAIQEMIADAQRSPKDHLDHLDEDEEDDDHKDDDHKEDEEDDNDGCISERTKLIGGASSGEGGRSGQNVQTSPPDVEPPTWKLELFWDLEPGISRLKLFWNLEPGISRLEFTSKCPHLTAQPE